MIQILLNALVYFVVVVTSILALEIEKVLVEYANGSTHRLLSQKVSSRAIHNSSVANVAQLQQSVRARSFFFTVFATAVVPHDAWFFLFFPF